MIEPMPHPATAAPPSVTASAATAKGRPADAASPLPQGAGSRVDFLALLLRLSRDIAFLPALLLALVTSLATRRSTQGPWYLSPVAQDSIGALSPRARRAVRRLLAMLGWALAGSRNRGMHPHARTQGRTAPHPAPHCGARAPPRVFCPPHTPNPPRTPRFRRRQPASYPQDCTAQPCTAHASTR